MSNSETFKIGDEVILKSGGDIMNVKDVLEHSCKCYWNDSSGTFHESTFNNKLLTKYVEPTLGGDAVSIV